MNNVADLKKQCLKDPEVKAAYESMADEFALASATIGRKLSSPKLAAASNPRLPVALRIHA